MLPEKRQKSITNDIVGTYGENVASVFDAVKAAIENERIKIFEAVGMGKSAVYEDKSQYDAEEYKFAGQIIGLRRTGKLDLGLSIQDANFYSHIKDNVYSDLAPDGNVLNSDELWKMDASEFPVQIKDGKIVK